MYKIRNLAVIIFLLMEALLTSCAGADIFPAIGTSMANPLELAVDSGQRRLYVLNSNYTVIFESGSMHVVDVSDPADPVRLNNVDIINFSGQAYLDTTNRLLYTPSRYSSSNVDSIDTLTRVNVDESSANFLSKTTYDTANDPFGIFWYAAGSRIMVASYDGHLDYYDVSGSDLTHASFSLATDLMLEGSIIASVQGPGANRVVTMGTQAFITNAGAGIWVVNLDKLGVAGEYPIEYFLSDIPSPRGIATDGTYVYVACIYTPSGGTATVALLVIDPTTLTPRASNTSADAIINTNTDVYYAYTNIEDADPQEVVIAGGNAYISHFGAGTVSIVETTGFTKTGSIAVGGTPYGMAVLYEDGTETTPTHLFVADPNANKVFTVDIQAGSSTVNTVVGTYP